MVQTFNYADAMDDLDERIAVLRRYRRMLDLQREKLLVYLNVLDQRDKAHAAGVYDGFEEYADQEQAAVRSIVTVQRCLEPLKKLYIQQHPEAKPDIADMEKKLEGLRVEVLRRNEESRNALRSHALELKKELMGLRATRPPVSLFGNQGSPSLVDIEA